LVVAVGQPQSTTGANHPVEQQIDRGVQTLRVEALRPVNDWSWKD